MKFKPTRNLTFLAARMSLIAGLIIGVSVAQADSPSFPEGNRFAVYVDTVAGTFNLNDPLQPFDSVIFSRDVYAVDLSDPANPVPTGPVIGSNMVQCTVAGPAGLLCSGTVTLFGLGDLIIAGPFVFQNPDEAAVTGGTGRFSGARGEMTALELNADADQVYWFDLSSSRN